MSESLIKVVILALAIAMVGIMAKTVKAQPQKADPAMYPKMRNLAFSLTREKLKLPPASNPNTPYGIIMDEGIKNGGIYTLVAWEDGATSVYLSSGGGFIGAGNHEIPNAAARKLVAEAAKYETTMTRTTDNALPAQEGEINFYLLTDSGLYKGSAKKDDLFKDADRMPHQQPLSGLYIETQKTLATIRKQVQFMDNK